MTKTILIKILWPHDAFDAVEWSHWRCKRGETGKSLSRLALHKAMREAGYCSRQSPSFDPMTVTVYHHDPERDTVHPNGQPCKIHLTEYRLTND